MAWNRERTIIAGVLGALIAVVAVVVFMNFVAAEKEIQTSLEHHYAVGDPQFRRELGTLLGPPIIDGNRVQGLPNGDEIFPAMFHCKTMIVDSQLVSVGSTNFDNRSFRLNEEANLNVYDKVFAQRLEDVFEQDLKRSRRITYESWKSRPWYAKVMEKLSSSISSQL